MTSQELAEAWKSGAMPLRKALRKHWKQIGLWPVDDHLMRSIEFVIGFANLGLTNTLMQVGDGSEMSVKEIIDRLRLSEFLE